MSQTCKTCGQVVEIGEWPFCPHGKPGESHSIQTDESFIGGVTLENMDHEPVTVYSRAEFQYEMQRRNLDQRIHHVPGDKYLTDWSKGTDPQTLENARYLVTHRMGGKNVS